MKNDLGDRLFMNTLVEHESAMEEMYRVFVDKVSSDNELWGRLAHEEHGHATILSEMLEAAKVGAVLIPDARVPTRDIKMTLDSLRSKVKTWGNWGVKRKEAFEYAIHMEESIVENCLYLPFEFEDARLFEVCQQMADASEQHAEQLRQAASSAGKTVLGFFNQFKK